MIQSNHGGAGFKAKRSTKRTVSTASRIAGKREDRRTRGVESSRHVERAASPTAKTAGENVPRAVEVAVAGPANVVGKSVTGDDAPRQTYEPMWTAENYVRLLRRSLTKECQSHIISNGSCLDALKSAVVPELGEDAVAALVKRAMTAVQVYLIFLYCSTAGRFRCTYVRNVMYCVTCLNHTSVKINVKSSRNIL